MHQVNKALANTEPSTQGAKQPFGPSAVFESCTLNNRSNTAAARRTPDPQAGL